MAKKRKKIESCHIYTVELGGVPLATFMVFDHARSYFLHWCEHDKRSVIIRDEDGRIYETLLR